jgi:hypothetical protein
MEEEGSAEHNHATPRRFRRYPLFSASTTKSEEVIDA